MSLHRFRRYRRLRFDMADFQSECEIRGVWIDESAGKTPAPALPDKPQKFPPLVQPSKKEGGARCVM